MINREQVQEFIQNKNFVMFFACLVYMLGILAFFSSYPALLAAIFTIFLAIFLIFDLFGIKRIAILIFIFYFGYFITSAKIKNHDDLLPLAPLNGTIEGRITSIPNSGDNTNIKFTMETEKVEDQNVQGKIFVTMPLNKRTKSLNIGQKISISGSLRRPFYSSNPSQFDYSSYLKNYNIFTVFYNNDGNFSYTEDELSLKWKFLRKLNTTRNKILEVHSHYLKSPNLEILGGIVFGNDAVAPPDYIKNSFINSGLLHILAASGMNVAFIFTFLFYILKFLKVPYKARTIAGIGAIVIYTFMTGLGPSVIRAALMLIFVLIGKLIDRDAHSISLLALVAVIMLLYNPAYINDVSFQLSFMVTFGLITTADVISQKFPKIPNWIKAPVIIPIIAQIWVIPIQMFYFNTISIYSIFANIAGATVLSAISFLGFISSLLAIFKPVSEFVCMTFDYFTEYLLNILINISNFFGNLPHCILQTTHPHILQILLYYMAILTVTYLLKQEKYQKALKVGIICSIILIISTIHPISKKLEIITFDVGNADCFMIKTPQNKYFFIDTGKSAYKSGNTQAKIIMLKYLKDRGIKNIEGVIVTHFDNDHAGGTKDFIENTNIKTLYLNNTERTTETSKEIFKTIENKNQNTKIVQNNEEIYSEPDLNIKTFKADFAGRDKSNENSTITLLTYKNFNTLFMADANTDSFNQIKSYIPQNIEILKVGHHGGAGVADKAMTEYLNNKVSIISTGTNYFGHPNKGTLDILRNTKILRTDTLKSIKISSDGETYKIYSYDIHDKKYKFKEKFQTK
ncbi:DNA internalization-related competence protein ComEC/Rec2 [bacterium]|nr:DNA internalization-related competence protein ComEC/Rec2 [bacterium]